MRISDWSSDVCSSDLSENVFQLQDFYHATDEGGEEMKLQQTSYVSGQRLKKDFSQVENAVYFTSQAIVVLQDGQPSTVPGALFVDGNLFDVLPVPFVRGDPAHALDDPHSLVLSEKAATKYFGNRSEEHTSELQSLMRMSYAVFCLK